MSVRGGGRVAWVHLRVAVMNELQYRANFFVQLLQSVVLVGTGLIALAVIFDHTDDLNGWTRPELRDRDGRLHDGRWADRVRHRAQHVADVVATSIRARSTTC